MKLMIVLASATLLFSTQLMAQSTFHSRTQVPKRGISKQERVIIAQQRHDVQVATRVAKADGYISPAERRIIKREKRQVRKAVCVAKNNNCCH